MVAKVAVGSAVHQAIADGIHVISCSNSGLRHAGPRARANLRESCRRWSSKRSPRRIDGCAKVNMEVVDCVAATSWKTHEGLRCATSWQRGPVYVCG
jgi:hypothetical protein